MVVYFNSTDAGGGEFQDADDFDRRVNSGLIKSLCRRGRAIVTEDKARLSACGHAQAGSPDGLFQWAVELRFYSSDRFEPPHVHAIKGGNEAKIWLQPIALEHNYGFNRVELNRIVRLTHTNRQRLLKTWSVYFTR